MKVKIIYIKSCKNGMNAGDSAMVDEATADEAVKAGEAQREIPPKSKVKEELK